MWSKALAFVVCFAVFHFTNAQRDESCRTPNGESARCVSIYDCLRLYNAVTTGDPQQRRFIKASQCGFDTYPLVCCGSYDNYRTATTRSTTSASVRNTRRNTYRPRRGGSSIPGRSQCGFQVTDRIFSGTKTDLEEFPWMALLQYSNSSGYRRFSCGGSLISSRYVLTAAHCVTGRILRVVGRLVNIRLGEYNTAQDVDCITVSGADICNDPPQNVGVEETIPHPGYSDSDNNRRNDIALVRLNRDVTFTDYIRPICLPSAIDESSVGEKLIVAGWGKTEKGTSSPIKLKVQVPFADRSQCYNKFRSAGIEIGNSQICAGGEAMKDSCTGDSGGPLMVNTKNDSNQWYIEGIVSFGTACGTPGWPGVYTKVYEYIDWIYENVED